VVPTDPDHQLPQTDPDVIANTLPRPLSSGPQYLSTVHAPQPPTGLEDEDLQLQAALQASLGEAGEVSWKQTGTAVTTGVADTLSTSANMGFPSSSLLVPPPPIPPPSTRPADQPTENPVAASMARNQALLERMRREQEAVLREHYHDETYRFDDSQAYRSSSGARNDVENEAEQLRRAIAESEEMAREHQPIQTGNDTGERARAALRSDRVYDDEDAEFQAALQASLLGADTRGSFSPGSSTESSSFTAASMTSRRSGLSADTHGDGNEHYDGGEGDTTTEETGFDTAEGPPPAEGLSIEEVRRRRLERFGGQ